ncbi:hypothetical protein BASA83_013214 [Batrachochytrium salamandrivorans]|nr:hypothetical protein BASA83_013214 [Batrachochytrium salamandrivorans]
MGWSNECMRCSDTELTTLVADKRDRWDEYLPQVLLAIRTRTHAVTGYSPFYLLFGTHPSTPNDETPPRSSLMPLDEIERMEEKLGIYCQELRRSWPGTISSKCQDQRPKAEAMRKRNGFDENTSDLLLSKLATMVKNETPLIDKD